MTAERMFVAAVMLVVGLVIGAFIADPAQGAPTEAPAAAVGLLDEAQAMLDEAEALMRETRGNYPEVEAILDAAELLMADARGIVSDVEAPGPMGLPARRTSSRSGYGPPPTTEDLMRGGELQAPAPGDQFTTPLASAPPSLEATGIEGVVVLVKPVEDPEGPSKYDRPPTPAEQWNALPLIVQVLLFFVFWSMIAALITVIGAGSKAIERRLRLVARHVTPERRNW